MPFAFVKIVVLDTDPGNVPKEVLKSIGVFAASSPYMFLAVSEIVDVICDPAAIVVGLAVIPANCGGLTSTAWKGIVCP